MLYSKGLRLRCGRGQLLLVFSSSTIESNIHGCTQATRSLLLLILTVSTTNIACKYATAAPCILLMLTKGGTKAPTANPLNLPLYWIYMGETTSSTGKDSMRSFLHDCVTLSHHITHTSPCNEIYSLPTTHKLWLCIFIHQWTHVKYWQSFQKVSQIIWHLYCACVYNSSIHQVWYQVVDWWDASYSVGNKHTGRLVSIETTCMWNCICGQYFTCLQLVKYVCTCTIFHIIYKK